MRAPRPTGGNDVKVIVSLRETAQEVPLRSIVPGTIVRRLDLVNAVSAIVPISKVEQIAKKPEVRALELDGTAHALRLDRPDDPKPELTTQLLPPGIARAHAPAIWPKTQGRDIIVAVVDTGIDAAHPDLAGRVIGGKNFTSPRADDWTDDEGHGTHVSGIIAANDNAIGVVGVAPQVSLLAAKVLDASGIGNYSDVIAGIEWALARKATIANMSLGGSSDVQALHEAIKKAENAGLIVVAAAGNSGEEVGNPLNYPGAYPEVVSVAAVDEHDLRAYFSSYNRFVALAANGVNILSLGRNATYIRHSGTSMATPHVTGAFALLRALFANEPIRELKRRLVCNADAQWPGARNVWTGYGILNVERAANAPASEQCDYRTGEVTEPSISQPVLRAEPPRNASTSFVKSLAFALINAGENKKQLVVTAKILTAAGAPVAGASLTSEIMERDTGPLGIASATTDTKGEAQFVLTGFHCGNYITRITEGSAPGFSFAYGQPEAEIKVE